ncbi:MAG: FxLYD domain-containing protein [Anaerolineae bacterium]|nr:FxLYD domain-containing protein [Anaerolineae bacterium]
MGVVKSLVNRYFKQGGAVIQCILIMVCTACGRVLTPLPTKTSTPTLTPNVSVSPMTATPTLAPGSFFTPIPPTPTLTPTPSPTPVIHIIERGDTLFGVALDYGVTLEALLNANSIAANDILRIGQALIIPLGKEEDYSSSGLQAPVGNMILPTPTPLPLEIAGVDIYQTPVGGILCMGEVVNSTQNAVTNMQVAVTLITADGMQLITGYTLAAADHLEPGMRAPFSMLFSDPPSEAEDVAVSLLRGENVSAITADFIPLTVVEAQGAFSGPQYRVRGYIANHSDRLLGNISVVVTIYNVDHNVIGYRQELLPDDVVFQPGESGEFSVLLTPQIIGTVQDFQVISWGLVQ